MSKIPSVTVEAFEANPSAVAALAYQHGSVELVDADGRSQGRLYIFHELPEMYDPLTEAQDAANREIARVILGAEYLEPNHAPCERAERLSGTPCGLESGHAGSCVPAKGHGVGVAPKRR